MVPSCSGKTPPHDASKKHSATSLTEPRSDATQRIAHTGLDSDVASCVSAQRHQAIGRFLRFPEIDDLVEREPDM